jgi:D-arabinonate dehydratase/D-galactarolactone cycloisomerase
MRPSTPAATWRYGSRSERTLKIVDVEAIALFAPVRNLTSPPFNIAYPEDTGSVLFAGYRTTLVRIRTDAGTTGFGECASRIGPQVTKAIVDELRPMLIGQNPLASDHLWHRLYATLRTGGHNAGFFIEALSGIDIALWDLRGKAFSTPVSVLLGGPHRSTVAAYGTGLTLSQPAEELMRRAQALIDRGYTIAKAKIGADPDNPELELEALRRLCTTFARRLRFIVDANGTFQFTTAIRVGRTLETLPVLWFEEPLAPDDRLHQVELARQLDIPVAGGESVYTSAHFRDLLTSGAYDIVQPNVARTGGITEGAKIATLAEVFKVPFAPQIGSSSGICIAATLQLAASSKAFLIFEHMGAGWSADVPNPFRSELTRGPVDVLANGAIPVPSRPGLGIEIDEAVIERYRVG